MTHSFAAAAVAACAAVTLGTPALASSASPWPEIVEVSQTVSLSDLDLHSREGAKEAAFRIETAANVVCGGDDPVMHWSDDLMPCRKAAIDRAVANLNEPLVLAALGRHGEIGLASR